MPKQMSVEDREAWAAWARAAPEWALVEFGEQHHMPFHNRACSSCGHYMTAEVHSGRRLWHCMECDHHAVY